MTYWETIMSKKLSQNPKCHSERSEESIIPANQALRFAQTHMAPCRGDSFEIVIMPSILVLFCLQIILAASKVDAAPLHVGDQRQVFIDGRFIEESNGVDLVVHPPQKTGQIVLTCEYPWEGRLGQYHSVLYDAGKPIRLRFVMRDADLYAFQFRKSPVLKDSR